MKQYKTLIVGYGHIGQQVETELDEICPDIADIKFPEYFKRKQYSEYDAIFICVNAPFVPGGSNCDLSDVVSAMKTTAPYLKEEGIFILRTTILPSMAREIVYGNYGYRTVFSPAWYGCTIHSDQSRFNFNFTVLGGSYKRECRKAQQIFQQCHDASHRFFITTPTTALMAKYMENCWIATKVVFCNQFAKIANCYDADYNEVREIFISDPRVNPSHTFVNEDTPYYDSHCTNKDIAAFAYSTALISDFMLQIMYANDKAKQDAALMSSVFDPNADTNVPDPDLPM